MPTGTRRVLLVSSRLVDSREKALRQAFQLGAEVDVVSSDEPLGDIRRYQAVVLDGPQQRLAADVVELLRGFVEAGGALLAIGSAPWQSDQALGSLLGAIAEAPRPRAELFGKQAEPGHALLRRVESEFPLVDSFSALRPLDGDTRVLLNVSWGFHDYPVALERTIGGGRIVVTSLGNSDEALQVSALSTLLSRSLKPPGDTQEERRLGVGLLGYGPQGGVGFIHGTAVGEIEGLELLAVCDQAADRREAAKTDFDGLRTYARQEDLAADRDIDIVVIGTPPVTHASLSLAMLRAGKHVACEKPLCLTVKEADQLITTAQANGVAFTVNQNRRWDSDFLAIRRALDAGLLGTLFNMETFVGDFAHPCLYWHSDTSISGGAIYDWGAHYIDWVLQLMPGNPAVVSASAHKRVWHDVTNADQVRVRMLWADGREAEFFYSDIAAVRKPKFYLQGTEGTLTGHYRPVAFERIDPAQGYVRNEAHFAEAPADLLLARYESGYGITETRLPPVSQPPFPFHCNLANHLHLGEPLAVTPESVRRVIAVLEAAHYSAQHGAVTVNLEEP